MIVGLTGGIGSGKSAAAALFAHQGIAVVDADIEAHALTAAGGEAMPQIREVFGEKVLCEDGSLDRAAMRQHIFADSSARQHLEAILHPRIRARCDALCRAATSPYVLLVVPLLIESGTYRDRVQRLVVVDCSEVLQVERVMARSGMSETDVRRIMATQVSRADRLAVADDVIDNSGTTEALAQQVAVLHERYLALALARSGCGLSANQSE